MTVFRALLDPAIATAEAWLPEMSEEEAPYALEEVGLERAHPDRLREFRLGRRCARRALAQFGEEPRAIPRAPDRSPVWPAGFSGSITHTRRKDFGLCAAAVHRSADFLAVGIDAELDEPLDEELFRRVLLDDETRWIRSQPQALQGALAKLFFSAKESFYKCQYMLSHQFLEFSDVRVTLSSGSIGAQVTGAESGHSGSFEAVILRDATPFVSGHAFRGKFVRSAGVIATAVTLPRP